MADPSEVLYSVFEVLIAVSCCLGNALVIWAVWVNMPRREPTSCFVLSLAMADFLVGAVSVPMSLFVDGCVRTSFQGCLAACCMVMALPYSSVLALLAIASDRFLRVFIPFRYKTLVTTRRSVGVVLLCWLLAGMLSITPMLPWSHEAFRANAPVNSSDMVCRFIDVIPLAYLVYFTFFGIILPLLLAMMALYSGVFHILQRRLRDSLSGDMEQQTYYLKEQVLTKVLTLVLLLFVACWLPLNVINSVTFFRGPDAVPIEVVYTGILLTHAQSAINPFLYGFRIRRIRDAYLQLWNRVMSHPGGDQQLGTISHPSNI